MGAVTRALPPDIDAIEEWLARLRRGHGLDAARAALAPLQAYFPENSRLAELAQWHQSLWWQTFDFGSIRLVRRGPEHLEFVRCVLNQREFAYRLKRLPEAVTSEGLWESLSRDKASLIPEAESIQWVVYRATVPIGLSMFVNISFRDRAAEQIMGVLPGYDTSFLVGDTYCASLMFAFNCLGLNKVRGLIYASNETIALQQERLGFKREGVLRSAVWNSDQCVYEDLIQIALLREEFNANRVLQRHIRRQAHSPELDQVRQFSREPLRAAPE